jgi:hypothetical protein
MPNLKEQRGELEREIDRSMVFYMSETDPYWREFYIKRADKAAYRLKRLLEMNRPRTWV